MGKTEKGNKCLNIGGQALVEGLMIKSPNYLSVSVRKPNNSIKTKVERFTSYTKRHKILGLPFIRGITILFEMLFTGMKQLIYSTNEQEEDDEESLSGWHIFFTVILSLVFAIFLFKALPLFLTKIIDKSFNMSTVGFNLIDGAIRISVFLLYIIAISFMSDVKTLFQYHGAEHKTIACYESGKKLTPENVKKFSTLHPRCGTSFVVFTLIISILVFSLIPSSNNYVALFFYRLPLLFPIAGLSYEFLKFSARFEKYWLFRQFTKPGLFIQKITTIEPNKQQIEVAIDCIKKLLKKEGVSS